MFYCDKDAVKNDWPLTMFRSYGCCEICGEVTNCSDYPSRYLSSSPAEEASWLAIQSKLSQV